MGMMPPESIGGRIDPPVLPCPPAPIAPPAPVVPAVVAPAPLDCSDEQAKKASPRQPTTADAPEARRRNRRMGTSSFSGLRFNRFSRKSRRSLRVGAVTHDRAAMTLRAHPFAVALFAVLLAGACGGKTSAEPDTIALPDGGQIDPPPTCS